MGSGVIYPLGDFDPKELNLSLPGNLVVAGTVTASGVSYNNNITATTSTALTVQRDVNAYYGLQVDESTASAATGLYIKCLAAASGLNLSVLSSGAAEALKLDAKGSGTITVGSVSTGNVILGTAGKTLTVANASGAVTIAAGGLTVTAGGITVTAGGILVTAATGLDTSAAGALEIGQTTATSVVIGHATTISAGGLTVTAGGLTVSAGGAAITGASTITAANASVPLQLLGGAAPSVDLLDVEANSTIVYALDKAGHVLCPGSGTVPTDGTYASHITSAHVAAGGSDVRGLISVVSDGTGGNTTALATITFHTAYAAAPVIQVWAYDSVAVTDANGWYVTSVAPGSFVLNCHTALTAGHTDIVGYEVIG